MRLSPMAASACSRTSSPESAQRRKQLYAASGTNGRVIEPEYVSMMNTMMEETLLTGTARKAELPAGRPPARPHQPDWRDAWFVGYTSHLVAGVCWQRRQFADAKSLGRQSAGRDLEPLHEDGASGRARRPLPSGVWRPARGAGAARRFGAELFGAGRLRPPRADRKPRRAPRAASRRAAESRARRKPCRTGGAAAAEDIPTGRNEARGKRQPANVEKNFFEKLFGGELAARAPSSFAVRLHRDAPHWT